jgi:anti-sigma B factor antagonist
MPETLRVDLPTASLALSLLERLEDYRAEVAALGGERYQVVIELDGTATADGRAQEGIARVESWLQSTGLDLAEIHLDDGPSRFERRDGSPLRSLDISPKGVVCRVKTTAVGTDVRVVSVEGEADLHTAPQLDDLLKALESNHVIVDLTEATFVDSTMVSVLVAADQRLRTAGGQLVIAADNPSVARLFEMTGLDRVLAVNRTLAEAIETALGQAVVEAHRQDGRAR